MQCEEILTYASIIECHLTPALGVKHHVQLMKEPAARSTSASETHSTADAERPLATLSSAVPQGPIESSSGSHSDDLLAGLFATRGLASLTKGLRRKLRMRRLLSARDADDILQDSLMHVLSRARVVGPDGIRDPLRYLHVTATRTMFDWVRNNARESRLRAAMLSFEGTEDRSGIFESLDYWDPFARGAVRGYVASLPPDLRPVYHQRYEIGRSERDSAAALGISYHTLRRLAAATARRPPGAHGRPGGAAAAEPAVANDGVSCRRVAVRSRHAFSQKRTPGEGSPGLSGRSCVPGAWYGIGLCPQESWFSDKVRGLRDR